MKFDDILAIDKRREEGAWVRTPSGDLAGLRLQVRSATSEVATKLASEILGAASADERKRPGFNLDLNKRIILDALLVDWEIEDRAFDRETAKAMVEAAAFREAVALCADAVGRDGAATLEADAKLTAALSWQLRWAAQESRVFIEVCQRYGRSLPEAYLNRPTLDQGLSFYVDAFWEVSTDRQIHQGGEGHIPFGAIDRYATRAGLNGASFWRFRALIRALDEVYLRHRGEVRERMRQQAVNENENRDVGKERVEKARRTMAKKSKPD